MSGTSSSNNTPVVTPIKTDGKIAKARSLKLDPVPDDKKTSDDPKPQAHVPTMFNMVLEALQGSKGAKGLTLQAIKRKVTEAYPSTKTKFSNIRLGKAIIKGIESGEIIRPKASEDTGLKGYFLFNKGLFAYNEKKKLAESKKKSDKKPAKASNKPSVAKSPNKPSAAKSPSKISVAKSDSKLSAAKSLSKPSSAKSPIKPPVSKSPNTNVEGAAPEKAKKPRAPKAAKKGDSEKSAKKKTPTRKAPKKAIKRKVPAAQANSTPKINSAIAKQKVASVKKAIKQITGAKKTKVPRTKASKD